MFHVHQPSWPRSPVFTKPGERNDLKRKAGEGQCPDSLPRKAAKQEDQEFQYPSAWPGTPWPEFAKPREGKNVKRKAEEGQFPDSSPHKVAKQEDPDEAEAMEVDERLDEPMEIDTNEDSKAMEAYTYCHSFVAEHIDPMDTKAVAVTPRPDIRREGCGHVARAIIAQGLSVLAIEQTLKSLNLGLHRILAILWHLQDAGVLTEQQVRYLIRATA